MKTKKSFADSARHILKRYPRAAFDPHEKAELEREMDALIQEQEAFKQAMGIDAMPQQQMELDANQAMMEGGMEEPQMFPFGSTGNDFDLLLKNKILPTSVQGNEIPYVAPITKSARIGSETTQKSVVETPVVPTNASASTRSSVDILPMQNLQGVVPGGAIDPATGKMLDFSNHMGATIGKGSFNFAGKPTATALVNNPKTVIDPKKMFEGDKLKASAQAKVDSLGEVGSNTNQFLPSYIAAGTTALGNIAQMFLDKKPKDVNFARYAPEEIDLTEQRLAAERAADLSRSVGRTTARNLGMNAGSTMANMMSTESDVSRNLSNALLQSKLQEQTTNVGERNKAGQINTEMGMRESMINRGMQDDWKGRQREYLAGAVQTVPDAMKDINQIKYQYEQLKQMGVSEENALKWLKQKYPNYNPDTDKMEINFKKK